MPDDGAFDYGPVVDQMVQGKQTTLQQTMVGAVQQDPDQAAQAQVLARQTGVPAPVVQRNLPQVQQHAKLAGFDYGQVIDATPRTGDWLSSYDNASMAHDDVPNLQAHEQVVQNHGYMGQVASSVMAGAYDVLQMPGQLGALAMNSLAAPYDIVAGHMGWQKVQAAAAWTNNPLNNWAKGWQQYWQGQAPTGNKDWSEALMDGRFGDVSKILGLQIAQMAPMLFLGGAAEEVAGKMGVESLAERAGAAAMPAQGAELPLGKEAVAGAATFGAQAAGARTEQLMNQGVSPEAAVPDALTHGGTAALAGLMGTFLPVQGLARDIAAQAGQPMARAVIKDAFKAVTLSMGGGLVGGATQVSLDTMADAAMGDPHATDDFLRKLAMGGLGMGLQGVGLGVLHGTLNLSGMVARAARDQATTSAFGSAMGGSKLAGRDALAHEGFVRTLVDGTDLEHTYIEPQAVDTYFQSRSIEPAYAMQELGPDVAKAYAGAKENGGLMQVATDRFIPALARTGHLDGLKDDLTYSPDNMSPNQVKALTEQVRTQAAQAQGDWQQSLAAVVQGKQAEFEAAGDSPDVAKAQAEQYGNWVNATAARLRAGGGAEYANETPQSFAQRYRFALERGEMSSADQAGIDAYNEREALDNVARTGGLTPLSDFVRRNGKLDYQGTQGELRDMQHLGLFGGSTLPDEMVERAREAGLMKPDATPDDLYTALRNEDLRRVQLEGKLGKGAVRRARKRYEQAAAAGPEEYQVPEREPGESSDLYLKRRWDLMPQDERMGAWARDSKTGMLSQRAWRARLDADGRPTDGRMVADVALEGGKWVNDTYGHEAGDEHFRVLGRALKDSGVEAYKNGGRVSFLVDSPEAFQDLLPKIHQALPERFGVQDSKGQPWTLNAKDLQLTGEVAPTDVAADVAHKEAREQLEARGERAPRGQQPRNLEPAQEEGPRGGNVNAEIPADLREKFAGMPQSVERTAIERSRDGRPTGFLTPDGRALLPERAYQSHADLAHMGLVNRGYSHESGDGLLNLAKYVMLSVEQEPEFKGKLDLVHDSGDEFSAQADDHGLLRRYWEKVTGELKESSPELDKEGVKYKQDGIYLSVGIGGSHEAAERNLGIGKERLAPIRTEEGHARLVHPEAAQPDTDWRDFARGLRGQEDDGHDDAAGNSAVHQQAAGSEAGGVGAGYENALKQSENLKVEEGAPRAEGAPYQNDLFGNAAGAALEHGAGKDEVRLKENAKPFVESKVKLSGQAVASPEDAVQAFSHLAQKSTEHLQALVLDAKGKPLALVAHTIGTTDTNQVSPQVLLGETLSVPGAAQVWIGHNHPSGSGELSAQDVALHERLADLFDGTNVELKGLLAIGAKKADGTQKFGYTNAGGTNHDLNMPADRPTSKNVPVLSRELDPVGAFSGKLKNSDDARSVAKELSGGRPGVLLLTAKSEPVGFVPVSPEDAGKMRGSGRMEAIYKAFASSNGAHALIYSGNADYTDTQATNLASFLKASNMNVLDVVGDHGSWMESGRHIQYKDSFKQSGRQGAPDPRAEISIMPGLGDARLEAVVRKLPGADLSTFTHELTHFQVDTMRDIVGRPDAPELVKRDLAALEAYAGVKDGKWTPEAHEKVAEAGEKYILEGKAPSADLQGLFSRLKAWMMHVYWRTKLRGVQLSDDVRGVFDRLYASDEQLQQAQGQVGMEPLPGLTDPKYLKDLADADTQAHAEMTERVMRSMRREQSARWREQRAGVEKEVAEGLRGQRDYATRELLEHGTQPGGEPLPEGSPALKLDKATLEDRYGKDMVARLPKVYAAQGGVDPDAVAAALGYENGDDLVRTMARTRPYADVLKEQTDALTQERFGEPSDVTSANLPDAAMRAVHNDKRAQTHQAELKYLAQNALPTLKGMMRYLGGPVPRIEELRLQAENQVLDLKVSEIQPNKYLRTETAARRETMDLLAKGDVAGAYKAKLKEAVNHELYRAAADARDNVEDILAGIKRLGGKEARQRIGRAGGDYLAQMDGLLDRYDFRKAVSGAASERRRDLAAWVEAQQDQGLPVDLDPRVLDETRRVSYKDATYGELQGLRDAVGAIQYAAAQRAQELGEDKENAFHETKAALQATHDAYFKWRDEALDFAPTLRQRMVKGAQAFDAEHARPEFVWKMMDGQQAHGTWWETFQLPFVKASEQRAEDRHATQRELESIFGRYSKAEKATWYFKKTYEPELNASLNFPTILSMALNQGNQYNREALLQGYQDHGWTQEKVDAVLARRLGKRDWDTVQMLWDHINSYWGRIAELHQRATGMVPKKVEAEPFDNKHGFYRGGYYPIKFNRELSIAQGELDAEQEVRDVMGGSYLRAQTMQGFTKERTNTGGKPLDLSLSVMTNHLSNVIHDLAYREPVIAAARLLKDRDVQEMISNAAGRKVYDAMHDWLHAVASDRQSEPSSAVERMFTSVRGGATVATLGLRSTTAMMHVAGYNLAVNELGPEYAARGVKEVYGKPWEFTKTLNFIYSLSPYMRDYTDTFDRDLRETQQRLNVGGVKQGPMSAVDVYTGNLRSGWLSYIGYANMASAAPAWMGAYAKAMEGKMPNIEGGDQVKAVEYADSVVRMTKGAGEVQDLAGVQRGPGWKKLFTMFYSQQAIEYNALRAAVQDRRLGGSVGRVIAAAATTWIAPAVLSAVIHGYGPPKDADEKEKLKWWAVHIADYPLSTAIGARDLVYGLERSLDGEKPEFEASPVFSALQKIEQAIAAPTQAFVGTHRMTEKDYHNMADVVGIGLGLPSSQLWRSGEYLHGWYTGEIRPQGAWDATKGVLGLGARPRQ